MTYLKGFSSTHVIKPVASFDTDSVTRRPLGEVTVKSVAATLKLVFATFLVTTWHSPRQKPDDVFSISNRVVRLLSLGCFACGGALCQAKDKRRQLSVPDSMQKGNHFWNPLLNERETVNY